LLFYFNHFQLAHDYVNRLGKNEITANDIDLVMNADTVFVEILRSDLNSSSIISNIDTSISTMSYNELIRHFIITETQYKDDLELLIKLFRNPIRNDHFEVRRKCIFYSKTRFFDDRLLTIFLVVWTIFMN
jgi:hypothetical protein